MISWDHSPDDNNWFIGQKTVNAQQSIQQSQELISLFKPRASHQTTGKYWQLNTLDALFITRIYVRKVITAKLIWAYLLTRVSLQLKSPAFRQTYNCFMPMKQPWEIWVTKSHESTETGISTPDKIISTETKIFRYAHSWRWIDACVIF